MDKTSSILKRVIVLSAVFLVGIFGWGIAQKNDVKLPKIPNAKSIFVKAVNQSDKVTQDNPRYKTHIKNKVVYQIDDYYLGKSFIRPEKGNKWESKPLK